MSTSRIDDVLAHIDAHLDSARGRWFELLRIPSISAQGLTETSPHRADCLRAASHMRDLLAGMGFAARLSETRGLPGVIATHHKAGPDAPTVLYYGHYDVQPADPLDLWHSDPFDPQLVDHPEGPRVVARGAVDDKGQVMMVLEAVRAWLDVTGGLPVNLTVLLEGEEECGSPSLAAMLEAEREALKADFVLVADTNMWDRQTPAITTSLRGLAAVEVRISGPDRDLHSGLFGGPALNPIRALTRILGDLFDADGRIRIPGFYDGILDIPADVLASWRATGFDEAAWLGGIGLARASGERGFSVLEQNWARPTAEINGIFGGYQGEGTKTVIPAEAGAKLTFRLVPGQDPAKVVEGFKEFVNARLLPDAKARFEVHGASAGLVVPVDLPFVRAARAALEQEFGRKPVLAGCGASIPVVEAFERQLGLKTLLVGFGLDDDCIHSPNEKFEMRCFHRGMRAEARMLAAFAG
ncbi:MULTISPECIES: dipeptidase [unclassified Acidiphilium]|uniref:dipeptidase n=1 Tax=unclassified Acidiphilium TaxID=2617493 RepID=UPI0004615A2E|nr:MULTISPECIES: dipeptidase [unclassified Acidiphilium]KDM67413.1 putative peptidase M20 [Acidiphilium sp. JA12-A1]